MVPETVVPFLYLLRGRPLQAPVLSFPVEPSCQGQAHLHSGVPVSVRTAVLLILGVS